MTSRGSVNLAPAAAAPADSSADTRRAALLLYSLPPGDREWLVAQLPEADRAVLHAMLADLTNLGIPAERELVAEVIGPALGGSRQAARVESPALRALELLDPAAVAGQLANEPPALAAHLLASAEASCRTAVLANLGSRRGAVEALIEEVPSAPALREALAAALVRRVQAAGPAPRGMRAWLGRLRGARP